MKRWSVFDGDESYYVECETKERAIPLYRKQWQEWVDKRRTNPSNGWWWERYGSKIKPVPDEDLSVKEVGQPEYKFAPRPVCCEKINEVREYYEHKGPVVQLRPTRRNPETGDYYSFLDPHWVVREVGIEIQFCPHCGTKLPEVERMENPPQPLWDGDDDYCGTCDERNRCCECNPPSAGYRIKT